MRQDKEKESKRVSRHMEEKQQKATSEDKQRIAVLVKRVKELEAQTGKGVVRSNFKFRINPSQNDKFFNRTKLRAFADGKLNFAVIMISLFDRVENSVGKGENAGFQHFLLFPKCFPKLPSLRLLKLWIVW